jgi:hypothetical protein
MTLLSWELTSDSIQLSEPTIFNVIELDFAGKQDPWVKLQENDPNKQCMQFQQSYQVPL